MGMTHFKTGPSIFSGVLSYFSLLIYTKLFAWISCLCPSFLGTVAISVDTVVFPKQCSTLQQIESFPSLI